MVVYSVLFCPSNKGHKTPNSQDYPMALSIAIGSKRYEVYLPSDVARPSDLKNFDTHFCGPSIQIWLLACTIDYTDLS